MGKCITSSTYLAPIINEFESLFRTILDRVKYEIENLPSIIQLSLERLAQFVQVALHTNSIYGSKREYYSFLISLVDDIIIFYSFSSLFSEELINRLQMLPRIRLLAITLSRHKEII